LPQFDIIFSREEHEAVVQWILRSDGFLTPQDLQEPNPIEIRDIEDYRSRVDDHERLFHIQHRTFRVAPLKISSISTLDGQTKHFVSQRHGGPTIDLLGPYDFSEGGIRRIAGGSISHYASFWNQTTGKNEKVPQELSRFYGRIRRQVAKNANRHRIGKRTYWIGHSTELLFRQGFATLPEGWPFQVVAQPESADTVELKFYPK
jgi:hypothetical protein